MSTPISDLHWENYGFEDFRLVSLQTIGDGNCFFHSLCQAFYVPYRTQKVNGLPVSRRQIVRELRYDLASLLGQPVDTLNPNGPTFYEELSRGKLPSFGENVPEYSFKNMQQRLRKNDAVGNEYNEFVSDQLEKDIYILDAKTEDIYITGDDDELLYKNRGSIVILNIPNNDNPSLGHYETIGIRSGIGNIQTYFSSKHPFIRFLRARMQEKREES